MKVPWCEYWEFLDAVVDIESTEGLQQFEMHLWKRLRELIDRRVAENARRELLQNTSICHLMHLLNLSNSSPRHSSQLNISHSHQDNNILQDVQQAVCTTWPPSLAKLLPHNNVTAEVTENSLSEESQKLPGIFADDAQLNGSHNSNNDNAADNMSSCSSDSFHTAGDDDSDFGFDLASDWPDEFDWQAVEPLFIYG